MQCWICKGLTPCACVERRAKRKTFAEMAAEDPALLQRVERCPPGLRIDAEKRGGLSWVCGSASGNRMRPKLPTDSGP
jgi:hypothetical protein